MAKKNIFLKVSNQSSRDKPLKECGIIKLDFVQASLEDRLTKVIGVLKHDAYCDVFVFDNGGVLKGIFSPNCAIRSKLQIADTRVKSFIRPACVVEASTTLRIALHKMVDSGYLTLAVKDEEGIVGAIHVFDVLSHLVDDVSQVNVQHVLKSKIYQIFEDDRVGKANQMFHESRDKVLLVMDKNNGNPVNTLVPFDIMRHIHYLSHRRDGALRSNSGTKSFKAERDDLLALTVGNFINGKQVVSIKATDSIGAGLSKMVTYRTTTLLIQGTPMLLTIRDILLFFCNTSQENTGENVVQFVGLHDLSLDSATTQHIEMLTKRYARKWNQGRNKSLNLKLHFKRYKDVASNKKHKYSIALHLSGHGKNVSVDHSHGWDITAVVHKALQDMERRLEH